MCQSFYDVCIRLHCRPQLLWQLHFCCDCGIRYSASLFKTSINWPGLTFLHKFQKSHPFYLMRMQFWCLWWYFPSSSFRPWGTTSHILNQETKPDTKICTPFGELKLPTNLTTSMALLHEYTALVLLFVFPVSDEIVANCFISHGNQQNFTTWLYRHATQQRKSEMLWKPTSPK